MLFGGQTTDVNTGADAGAAGSSTAEGGDSTTVVDAGAANAGADPLNTEEGKAPETIPYSRFKEINDAKKSLEEKLGKYSPYEQMDEILQKNPELYAEVEKTFKGYAERIGKTQGQPQGQSQGDDKVAFLENKLKAMEFNEIRKEYKSSWNDLTKDVAEEEKAALMKLTELEMYARHNAPYAEYNQKLLADSFKAAKEMLDKMVAGKTAGYVKSKVDDDVPGSGAGAPASREKIPMTREERSAAIAAGLKAGH